MNTYEKANIISKLFQFLLNIVTFDLKIGKLINHLSGFFLPDLQEKDVKICYIYENNTIKQASSVNFEGYALADKTSGYF